VAVSASRRQTVKCPRWRLQGNLNSSRVSTMELVEKRVITTANKTRQWRLNLLATTEVKSNWVWSAPGASNTVRKLRRRLKGAVSYFPQKAAKSTTRSNNGSWLATVEARRCGASGHLLEGCCSQIGLSSQRRPENPTGFVSCGKSRIVLFVDKG
jgi:hypothetical protein